MTGKVYYSRYCAECVYLEISGISQKHCTKLKATFWYNTLSSSAFFEVALPECFIPKDESKINHNGMTFQDSRQLNRHFVTVDEQIYRMTIE